MPQVGYDYEEGGQRVSNIKHRWDVPKKLYAKYESNEYRTVYEHGQECLLMPLADVMDLYEELHQLRKSTRRKKRR